MQSLTRWADLWHDLAELNNNWRQKTGDNWGYQPCQAQEFAARVAQRWQTPDSSRDHILSYITSASTVLDIGSGTGAWTALIARQAKSVTTLEPDVAMVEQMRALLAAEEINNVTVIQDSWPGARVEMHDFSLCSHAMYGILDLPVFIWRMVEVTRKTCFLLVRAPAMDGVMAEAARRVLGQPHDSPNFTVAYNVLLEMGIYANVLMESSGIRKSWKHESLLVAWQEIKLRLGITGSSVHDDYLMDLLKQRLVFQQGVYVWPPAIQTALIYWDVE